jgi:hypothetical protein
LVKNDWPGQIELSRATVEILARQRWQDLSPELRRRGAASASIDQEHTAPPNIAAALRPVRCPITRRQRAVARDAAAKIPLKCSERSE